MAAWWWAVWAALAMIGQDLVMTWLVQAEARGKPNLAGLMDVIGWPMGMLTTLTTVNAWQGHDGALKGLVVLLVSIANFAGTSTAVRIGQRRIKVIPPALVCTCRCAVHPEGPLS